MAALVNEAKPHAERFVTYLNKAVSPYHAVDEGIKLLKASGFNRLDEKEDWQGLIKNNGKYFVIRNQSTVFAFAVGGKYESGNGFSIVAAHTDSPGLRVKPVSKQGSKGYLQVGVSTYGGGLWRTWFDRDLSVAGLIVHKKNENQLGYKLVHIERPILSVPNLAIHLDRNSNDEFKHNKEDHIRPILMTGTSAESSDDHHQMLIEAVADEAMIDVDAIVDMDLCVIDTQLATIAGIREEFIHGGRLDNLVGTYTAIQGLIASLQGDSLDGETNVRVAVCYDNEECGSDSAQGAGSSFTEWMLRRITASATDRVSAQFEQAIAKSYLISADQAHAVHPCYTSKHEENHQPSLHGGVVVKINLNQRYATTATTHAVLKTIADKADLPLQKFVIRNDSACGSTVGPILSAKLGLATIDVGTAQLAMHSIREMCGTTGILQATMLFKAFYRTLPEVLGSFDD